MTNDTPCDPTVSEPEIVEAMRTYGGGFARALAEAATRADPANYARLAAAFPELWTKYREIVCLQRARDYRAIVALRGPA